MAKQLIVPPHYDSKNAFDIRYRPPVLQLPEMARKWAKGHGITHCTKDAFRIAVLLIDGQIDFCFPEGTLYVGGRSGKGAMEDNDRFCQFLYKNMNVITELDPTLDTHVPFSVHSRSAWLNEQDDLVGYVTQIPYADIASGKVKINPAAVHAVTGDKNAYGWLDKQWRHYAAEVERKKPNRDQYTLTAWTEHCILGDIGHALAGVLHEARMFHAYARGSQNMPEIKGGNPLTENYSIFQPEVLTRWDGKGAVAQRNTKFLQKLLAFDAVVIAGQAGSHCVKSSIDDILEEVLTQDASLAKKIYVLEDCMSPVAVPNPAGGFYVDYTDQQAAALKKFADAGMHVVKSTTPINEWDGIRLAA